MSLIKEVLLGFMVIALTTILIAATLAVYAFSYSTQQTVITKGGNELWAYGKTSNKDSYQHLGNLALPANKAYSFVYTMPVDDSGIDLYLKPIGKRNMPDWKQVDEGCRKKFPAKSMLVYKKGEIVRDSEGNAVFDLEGYTQQEMRRNFCREDYAHGKLTVKVTNNKGDVLFDQRVTGLHGQRTKVLQKEEIITVEVKTEIPKMLKVSPANEYELFLLLSKRVGMHSHPKH